MSTDRPRNPPTTGGPDEEGWLLRRLQRHLSEMARLSGPIIVSRAGVMVMGVVDTIMVGRYGTDDLAFVVAASGLSGVLFVVGIGFLQGTTVATANALGRDRPRDAVDAWWRSWSLAIGFGVMTALLLTFGSDAFLATTGQPEEIREQTARAMAILGWGLPAAFLYITSSLFLEALKRPGVVTGMMILANVLNALFNWVLIWGEFGFAEMGGMGSAWATTWVRVALAITVLIYLFAALPERKVFNLRRLPAWDWAAWRRQRWIGITTASSLVLESGSFGAMTLIAGWIGTVELAAYGISQQVFGMIFMIAVGTGTATAVRVGVAHGRRDWPDLQLAGWAGLGFTWVLVGMGGVAILVLPGPVASIYSGDPVLIALLASVLFLAALIVVPDGGQMVMASALRARGDALWPTLSHLVAYPFVMVPSAYLFAVRMEFGVAGLLLGILLASVVSCAALAYRFHRLRDTRESLA